MKKSLILLLMLNFFASNIFAYGINDAVEDSRNGRASPPSSSEPNSDRSSKNHSSSGSCFDVMCDVCTNAATILWLEHIFSTRYKDYPYENSNGYIFFSKRNSNALNEKFYRLSASASPFYFEELGWGADFRLEGMFYCIGGILEYSSFRNTNDPDNNPQGNLRLGLQVPLVQFDKFSLVFSMLCSDWYGDANPILKDEGLVFGAEVGSFLVNPFHLNWKGQWHIYNEDVSMLDSVLTCGILFGRYELYAGWKYFSIYNNATARFEKDWNGITGGVRIWF